MALPTSGLLEKSPGGSPLVRDFGLNTLRASNLAGFLVDTSGNVTFPGTVTYAAGNKPNIISGSGATVTLTAAQSGSIVLFDRAAGIVFTLPAPVVGLGFTFWASVTVTTNSYKIITDAGSTLIAGSILGSVDNTANKSWVGNGTNHIAITQAAASTNATGGIVGSYVSLRCVSSTLWLAYGLTVAGGTPSTPFATS